MNNLQFLKSLILISVLLLPSTIILSEEPIKWTDDSFEDFVNGHLDASGQNLYVSHEGSIRNIHRFDLNHDSYLDLIFNSTHDTFTYIPATLALVDNRRKINQFKLSVEGSLQVALDDLNKDGYLDAIFCPNNSGLQTPRRFVTILWGGKDGWSNNRSNGQLPVYGASDVTTADLNQDGWPDIVTLNKTAWLPGQPKGNILRIFWGSESGFLLNENTDFGITQAIDIIGQDFDGDGHAELAILTGTGTIYVVYSISPSFTSETFKHQKIALPNKDGLCLTSLDANIDGHMDLLIGTNHGRLYLITGKSNSTWNRAKVVPAPNASQIASGYLNNDQYPDIALTNFSSTQAKGGEAAGVGQIQNDSINILWGSSSGYNPINAISLPIPFAKASAIGDIDGDGNGDLAVAVHQNSKQFETNSLIFLGNKDGKLKRQSTGIQTFGANHTVIVPPTTSLPGRVIFCNSLGGTVGEEVPLYVYWGSPKGFSPENRWDIPFRSGYEASAADINIDGYVDLITLNSQHAGDLAINDPTAGANIFWGSKIGFNIEKNRTILKERNLGSSNVADLNRDGFLDLVLGAFEDKQGKASLVIYYGSAAGFEMHNRKLMSFEQRTIGSLVADFNRDQWLDIAFVSPRKNRLTILWGSKQGFDLKHKSNIKTPFPISLESADFNQDGFLDIVVGSYMDTNDHHHDTGLTIYWGSINGFRSFDSQWLPGFTPIGLVVADFDKDGYLDLFSPHYLADLTRESLPSYLYWGSPNGFSPRNRSILITDSAHDGMAGDFNKDGKLDLAVSCHTLDGNHNTVSKVFYNHGNRFKNSTVVELPTIGTHWMWIQDVGHIYDRKWEQAYDSSIFKWNKPASEGILTFQATLLKDTSVIFEVRSSKKNHNLSKKVWKPIKNGVFKLKSDDRQLQYRAKLISKNGDLYPVLDQVTIQLKTTMTKRRSTNEN